MKRMLIIIVVLVLGVVLFASVVVWTQPYPHFEKLAECNQASHTFSFVCPPGDSFNIVLVFQNVTNLADLHFPDFAGSIVIKEGPYEVFLKNIPTQKALFPFWLDQDKHLAFYCIIFPDTKSQVISKILKPKYSYTVNVAFSKQPPQNTELWLMWRQSRIDGFD